MDWFYALESSQLIIKVSSADSASYKYLDINKDVYLSEDEIRLFLKKMNFRGIKTYNVKQKPVFSSMEDVINKLNEKAGKPLFQTISPRCSFSSDGNPLIIAKATLNYNKNECLTGLVDLMTGIIDIRKSICYIIN